MITHAEMPPPMTTDALPPGRSGVVRTPGFQSSTHRCIDSVVLIDRDGRIRSVASDGRLLGHRPGDLHGRHYGDLVHPQDLRRFPSEVSRLATHFDNALRTLRLRSRGGQWVWVQTLGADLLGGVGGVGDVGDDPLDALVLSIRPAQPASRDEDPANSLSDTRADVSDALVVTDADVGADGPRILYANERFTRLTGYSPSEVLGEPPSLLHGPRTSRLVLDRLRDRLERGRPFHGEAIHYRKDGSEFWMDWSILPIRDASGGVTHLVSTHRDITRRKLLQEGMTRVANCEQRRVAEDLHDSLQQVLVAAGMQLQTLIARLNRSGQDAEAALGSLIASTMDEAVEQSRGLVRWLNPVRLETGGLVDAIADLTDSIRRLFRLEITFDGPPWVDVDLGVAMHIYRITQEAIHNAMKHARASDLRVALLHNGDWGEVSVEDNGSGLSDEALRGDHGMGLRLMDYRARLAGGDLYLEPSDTGGTRVRCRFPLRNA